MPEASEKVWRNERHLRVSRTVFPSTEKWVKSISSIVCVLSSEYGNLRRSQHKTMRWEARTEREFLFLSRFPLNRKRKRTAQSGFVHLVHLHRIVSEENISCIELQRNILSALRNALSRTVCIYTFTSRRAVTTFLYYL